MPPGLVSRPRRTERATDDGDKAMDPASNLVRASTPLISRRPPRHVASSSSVARLAPRRTCRTCTASSGSMTVGCRTSAAANVAVVATTPDGMANRRTRLTNPGRQPRPPGSVPQGFVSPLPGRSPPDTEPEYRLTTCAWRSSPSVSSQRAMGSRTRCSGSSSTWSVEVTRRWWWPPGSGPAATSTPPSSGWRRSTCRSTGACRWRCPPDASAISSSVSRLT